MDATASQPSGGGILDSTVTIPIPGLVKSNIKLITIITVVVVVISIIILIYIQTRSSCDLLTGYWESEQSPGKPQITLVLNPSSRCSRTGTAVVTPAATSGTGTPITESFKLNTSTVSLKKIISAFKRIFIPNAKFQINGKVSVDDDEDAQILEEEQELCLHTTKKGAIVLEVDTKQYGRVTLYKNSEVSESINTDSGTD